MEPADVPHISDCVITFGSNIEPEMNVSRAVAEIGRTCEVVRQSKRERVKAVVGPADQNDCLNGAIHVRTHLTKGQLNDWLRQLEQQLGQAPTTDRSAPHTIRLDIIVWNGQVVDPDVYKREFLKDVVQELWPGLL
jgi:2-amino-4-hydroxy-6-hydroxymethyldihydropteridine diphosphokinase